MKTTRAMLVIGVLMLVLAVIVTQGLRPDEPAAFSNSAVAGAVLRASAPPSSARSAAFAHDPAASASSALPRDAQADAGPLKADAARSAPQPPPINPPDPVRREDSRTRAHEKIGVAATPPASANVSGTAEAERKTAAPRNAQSKASEKILVTTGARKTLTAGQKAVSRTRLEIGPHTAAFRLTGASALKGKAFILKEPNRIVMDLNGSWGINLGRTPPNALIKSVRSGVQDANTRLVFDMHKKPKSFKLIQVDSKTLELQMR